MSFVEDACVIVDGASEDPSGSLKQVPEIYSRFALIGLISCPTLVLYGTRELA